MLKTNSKRIDVIDGIRSFAILWIGAYHLWLESWLTPYMEMKTNIPKYFGIYQIDISTMLSYGYIFVDIVMILSAFCVFLPYAEAIINNEKWPDTKTYFIKRAIRILPSYYLTVFLYLFAYAIPFHKYKSLGFLFKDLITHLTFTSWIFPDTYYDTCSNGVLWAVQVEVIFYLLMPLLARLFKKWTEFTYVGMLLIGIVSANVFLLHGNDVRALENNPITYMSVYANGIMLCFLYVWWKKNKLDNRYTRLTGMIISIGMIFFFRRMIEWYISTGDLVFGKLKYRTLCSFFFCVFIFATLCANETYQKIFSNRLTRAFAFISYNYFIWHQAVYRLLKYFKIPYWEGETLPNEAGNRDWMIKFSVVSIALSIIVAVIVTKFFDVPVTGYLKKKFVKGKREITNESN